MSSGSLRILVRSGAEAGAILPAMRVRLLAFAVAADRIGARETTLELAPGATVGDLRRAAVGCWPALAGLAPRLAIAVDGAVAVDEAPLAEGAEVALLPPVSGG